MPRKVRSLLPLLPLLFGLAPARAQVAPYAAPRLGLIKKASALVGEQAFDERDKKLGRVHALVGALETGGVPLALVALGSGGVIPIPTDLCSDASVNRLVLKVKKASLGYVPQVDPAHAIDASTLEQAWKYFHGTAQGSAGSGNARHLSAARLLGLPLRGAAGEPLGSVNDLMVDLPTGRLVYLVIAPADRQAAQGDFYVVPPAAVQFDERAGAMTLKCDRMHFLAGPHVEKAFWSDITFPALASAVREHYPG